MDRERALHLSGAESLEENSLSAVSTRGTVLKSRDESAPAVSRRRTLGLAGFAGAAALVLLIAAPWSASQSAGTSAFSTPANESTAEWLRVAQNAAKPESHETATRAADEQTASREVVTHAAGESRTFDGIEFVWIPAGSFLMGSPVTEDGRDDDEAQHQVTISNGFWLGKYEVTQAQWTRVMGNNPANFEGDTRPVEQVSWDGIREFLARLNANHEGPLYHLPTEAAWEYACRAGASGPFGFDVPRERLTSYGWFVDNSDRETHPAGLFEPNAWGLYDMHGNVWEWCQDWYGDYPSGSVTDPTGPDSGVFRVLRGGSCTGDASECRAANRHGSLPDNRYYYFGFRIARAP